jgi:hypothetical protein
MALGLNYDGIRVELLWYKGLITVVLGLNYHGNRVK